MRFPKYLPALLLTILLAACVFAFYFTADSRTSQRRSPSSDESLVDTSTLQTALALSSLAATSDEQAQAREAWRLADHALDLTFAAAMRDAEAQAALPVTGPLRQLSDIVDKLKAKVDADKKRADQLEKDGGDGLEIAQAQLTLDQDELDDAQQDLARAGGDKKARLRRLLDEHEASDKVADQAVKYPAPAPTGTLAEQLRAWSSLGGYDLQLQTAAAKAAAQSRSLLELHNTLERQLPAESDTSMSVARMRQLSQARKALSGLDQRIEDTKQLSSVYQRWSAIVENRRRSVLHLALRSLAAILGILLVTVLLNLVIGRSFHRIDRRRLHQLRVIARITSQLIAVLVILLILFGPPTQISTIIGLVTAGLTVVMKDFIVAFFGWFTLMGKNGISVGDWVEIEGVSGEVIQIGLLTTVLLELGNWTEKGHPTGRRVAFSNSFAMERHYFNFSTSGQWLWDEIQLTIPSGGDPYGTAEKIREIVERETQVDAEEATKDWQRVTQTYAAREFSAKPAVNLRPSTSGLELVVRYITRAPKRNATKSRLFHVIVDLLRNSAATA